MTLVQPLAVASGVGDVLSICVAFACFALLWLAVSGLGKL